MATTSTLPSLTDIETTLRAIPGVASVTRHHAPGSALERLTVTAEGDNRFSYRVCRFYGRSRIVRGWETVETKHRHLLANTLGRIETALQAARRALR